LIDKTYTGLLLFLLVIVGTGYVLMSNESIAIPPKTQMNEITIALGLEPNYTLIDKFGKNPDVDTSYEDIWNDGGVLTLLSTPSTLTVTTTGVDTDGGTGARILTIQGLDANWNLQSANVTLNSTTPPVTPETWLRINRAFVATAGTGLTNANDILITATTGGSVQAHILADEGQTQKTQYTIPAGYTGFLEYGRASTDTGQHVDAQLMVKPYGGAWLVKHDVTITDGHVEFDMLGSSPIPEKSEIKWRAKGSLNNNELQAGYTLILRNDN
jgi:hypothetical protein